MSREQRLELSQMPDDVEEPARPAHSARERTEEELRDMMKALIDNPASLDAMSDEDVIALKQRINPIGTFAPLKESYAVASIINMREQDMRKFLTTAMIGFVYRRLAEYVPTYVTRTEESYAQKINDITSGPQMQERRDALREECTRITREYRKAHQDVIRAFLDSIFLFNPDKHVRQARAETQLTARDVVFEGAPSAAATAFMREVEEDSQETLARDKKRERKCDAYYAAGVITGIAERAGKQIELATKVIENCTGAEHSREDARQFLIAHGEQLKDCAQQLRPYARTDRTVHEIEHALCVNPPADVFYHFGRYIDSHYELLRAITNAVYQTHPQVEDMIIYYDTFDTPEAAREYIRVHEAEFRADPKIIENGGVTLLGPFRENRAIVDFYNRHTEVLRQMSEQVARDHQLGSDIIKKKVVAAKRENVRAMGADDAAGLDRYMSARGIIAQFGQRPELSREEREQLARAEQTRAEFEAPGDALVARVLQPVLDADGQPIDLRSSFFYSAATNVMTDTGKS